MAKLKKIVHKLKCLRCDWQWLPKFKRPSTCPRCKSYNYDKPPVEQKNQAA